MEKDRYFKLIYKEELCELFIIKIKKINLNILE
jgi:hypothetical protein